MSLLSGTVFGNNVYWHHSNNNKISICVKLPKETIDAFEEIGITEHALMQIFTARVKKEYAKDGIHVSGQSMPCSQEPQFHVDLNQTPHEIQTSINEQRKKYI